MRAREEGCIDRCRPQRLACSRISPSLVQAYAAARMAESTLLGLNGEPNIYECAFVQSDVSAAGGRPTKGPGAAVLGQHAAGLREGGVFMTTCAASTPLVKAEGYWLGRLGWGPCSQTHQCAGRAARLRVLACRIWVGVSRPSHMPHAHPCCPGRILPERVPSSHPPPTHTHTRICGSSFSLQHDCFLTGFKVNPLPPPTHTQVVADCPFFASKVLLGPNGVAKVMGLGELDAFEQAAMAAMLPQLKSEIQKGLDFVKSPPAPAS